MLLIQNGTVWTMAGEKLEPGCVLIENGKIRAVERLSLIHI